MKKLIGDEAQKWNAIEAFRTFEGSREKRILEQKQAAEAAMEKLAAGFSKTESGLRYQIIQKGSGKQAEKGKKGFRNSKQVKNTPPSNQ